MARFYCKCGYVLSNSVEPEIEYRVYSDSEWLEIVNNEDITEGILIPDSKLSAWVCPKCERVYIWDDRLPLSVPIKVLVPEKQKKE